MTARTMPTLPTFPADSGLTSGQLTQLETWLNFWANPPMFRMFQTVAQPIPSGTPTQVTFDSVASPGYDTDSGRASTTPWSYIIPVGFTGRWTFMSIVNMAGNASGYRYPAIYQNGAEVQGGKTNSPVNTASNSSVTLVSATIPVTAGDTIGIYMIQNSGSSLTTVVSEFGQLPVFEGRMVSLANP